MSDVKAPREYRFGSLSFNEDEGTVEVVYSTGKTVDRGTYIEELVVSPDSIDRAHLDAGAVPLLMHHDWWGPIIGRVVDHVVEDGQARAKIVLSVDPQHAGIVSDIRAGVLRSVSVGYEHQSFEESESDGVLTRRVTRWLPLEISIVAVPADAGSHIRSHRGAPLSRNAQEVRMENDQIDDAVVVEEKTGEAATAVADATVAVEDAAAALAAAQTAADEAAAVAAGDAVTEEEVAAAAEVAAAQERARVSSLIEYATRTRMPHAALADHIASGRSIQEVRSMTTQTRASSTPALDNRVRVDASQKRAAQVGAALYAKLGGKNAEVLAGAGEYRGMRMSDIARETLSLSRSVDEREVFRRTVQTRAAGMHTTSDFSFTSSLTGAIERRVREIEAMITIPLMPLVVTGTARDDRPVDTYSAGGFPELRETPEGAEYEAGTILADGNSIRLKKYGRILNVSEEAFIRDDLMLLQTAINGTASAGRKLEQKLIRAAFSSNMSDGKPLFVSTGKVVNKIVASLTVEGLSKARAALRKQPDLDGEPMNLEARYLIVSTDDETAAQQLVSPITAALTGNVNPFAGTLTVIVDPMLQSGEWILAADPIFADAIQLLRLDGHEGVDVREFFDPRVDGLSWRARHFAGAGATGRRGFVKATAA